MRMFERSKKKTTKSNTEQKKRNIPANTEIHSPETRTHFKPENAKDDAKYRSKPTTS